MELQRLLSLTRKAIDDYGMIQKGDVIAVGVSGGKDSLTMLYALSRLRRFYPEPFEIHAISVDLGFPEGKGGLDPITDLCRQLEVPYKILPTNIAEVVFDIRKESNPCSLCAKLRKGAFNDAAKELGCNKVAYAHHKNDLIETMLMSMIYEGRFYCFSPVSYLDRMNLTVIRPLMYVEEADVIGFKNRYALPVFKNPCPADGFTRRQYAKELIARLNQENPGASERLFTALLNGNIEGWPERTGRQRGQA